MIAARDNPFRSERVESLAYRAPGFSWQALVARLLSQGGRGAIRGGEGTGKTTLLHELGDRLEGQGYLVRRLRPEVDDKALARRQVRRFGASSCEQTALLLDGADRVGPLAWRGLLRRARPAGVFVMTTHREGRLSTLHRCETSRQLLDELVAELVPANRDERGDDTAGALLSRAKGNIRVALRELYDRAARDGQPVPTR